MDENSTALIDPDETASDIDPAAIDDDWNSAPDDKLGATDGDDDGEEGGDDNTEDQGILPDAHATAGENEPNAGGGSDQSYSLKHLGTVKNVGRDEVITLAQKGLDYDRIRGRYDEAAAELSRTNDAYALLKELAAAQSMTAEQLVDATRAQLLVQQQGLSPAEAARQVGALRASGDKLSPRSGTPEYEAAAKRRGEIREFLNEYGTGVDPKTIPREVWQAVAAGRPLLAAYQAWELKKLRLENGAARQNTENKRKSAGSRFSFGGAKPRDAIAADWFDT